MTGGEGYAVDWACGEVLETDLQASGGERVTIMTSELGYLIVRDVHLASRKGLGNTSIWQQDDQLSVEMCCDKR